MSAFAKSLGIWCEACKRVLPSREALAQHQNQVHSMSSDFLCPIYISDKEKCPFKSSSQYKLAHHLAAQHAPLMCTGCKVRLNTASELMIHAALTLISMKNITAKNENIPLQAVMQASHHERDFEMYQIRETNDPERKDGANSKISSPAVDKKNVVAIPSGELAINDPRENAESVPPTLHGIICTRSDVDRCEDSVYFTPRGKHTQGKPVQEEHGGKTTLDEQKKTKNVTYWFSPN